MRLPVRLRARIVIAAALAAIGLMAASSAAAHTGSLATPGPVRHWVALVPADYDIEVDLEGAREGEAGRTLTLATFDAPGGRRSGEIRTRAIVGRGYEVRLVPETGPERAVPLHLSSPDQGYGHVVHLTVLEDRGRWVSTRALPDLPPVWLDAEAGFETGLVFGHLAEGETVEFDGRRLVIEHVNADGLLVREEQEHDDACGGEMTALEPYTSWTLPQGDWTDEAGRSRFRPGNPRGC